MKKIIFLLLSTLIWSCDSEDANDCFQKAGDQNIEEILLSDFDEIVVYDKIKLFIEQGPTQKVLLETGENLRNDISVEVIDGQLILRNENDCNFVRDYNLTNVYVTVPELTYIRHAGNLMLESVGTLNFEQLWLVSENQDKDPDVYTNGDFKLELEVDNLRITSDNYSHFFLSGNVENFDGFFAAGDSRLEARELIVQHYDLLHRGTNKLIVNPQQSLKADLYSYGDIISVNKPVTINVTEHFEGRLIFE